MRDKLSGLRVVIEVQEGMEEDIVSFSGTIVRRLKAPDGDEPYMVRLDRPVRWGRATIGRELTLNNLVVSPVFKGDSMDALLRSGTGWRDYLPCEIANILVDDVGDKLPTPDLLDYFARGVIRNASNHARQLSSIKERISQILQELDPMNLKRYELESSGWYDVEASVLAERMSAGQILTSANVRSVFESTFGSENKLSEQVYEEIVKKLMSV